MDSMPMLDDDFNYDALNLDFLESPPRNKSKTTESPNQKNSYFKTPSPLKGTTKRNPVNNVLESTLQELKLEETAESYSNVSKTEIQDFNFDFLASPQQNKTNVNPSTEYFMANPHGSNIIKTENPPSNSIQSLSKRIANVDELVRKIKHAEEEKKNLQKQLEEFNRNVKDIQLLYNKEKKEHAEADVENKTLMSKCQDLEIELTAKSFELEQVQAIVEDSNGPLSYRELAIRYLKFAQKLEEGGFLHWHDQNNVKEIKKFFKDKGIKIPAMITTPRSPPKRKVNVRKNDAEVQCELLTTTTTTIAAADEQELQKSIQVPKQDQSTQCLSVETRNQGCQHIGTTTTRATTTSCFFKYHDVGINTDEEEKKDDSLEIERAQEIERSHELDQNLDDILNDMRSLYDEFFNADDNHTIKPISPIPEPPIAPSTSQQQLTFNSIETNAKPKKASKHTLTKICNIRRELYFTTPTITDSTPISIKRSNSRPSSSTNLLNDTVKDELNSNSSNTSPVNMNFQPNNNRIPSPVTLEPNTFYEDWQRIGRQIYCALYRPMTNIDTTIPTNNITQQQDFYNWLYSLHNNINNMGSNQISNGNPNITSLVRSELLQILYTAATTEHTDSHISNNNTPLIFSNAAPSQSSATNILKPTAQRSSLNNSSSRNEETDLTNQKTRKSVATSPIQCLNATQIEVSESSSSENSIESPPAKTKTAKLHKPLKNDKNPSAFSLPNKKQKILNKNSNNSKEICNNAKTNKLKVLNPKSNSIKKQQRPKSMETETAVEFLAKLHDFHEQTSSKDLSVNEQQSSRKELERISTKKSQVEKCEKETSLRRLNYQLFGSDTETDSESVTELDLSTSSTSSTASNESFLSCSSSSSFESSSSGSPYSEEIVDNDVSIEETAENLTHIESKQNETSVEELKDSNKTTTNSNIDDITSNDLSEKSLIIDETVENLTETSSENLPPLPKKRGRKRKCETSPETQFCPSPVKTPCKRSARLLAKNTNLNLLQTPKQDNLIKSNRKRQSNTSENPSTITTRRNSAKAKTKQIEKPATMIEFENVDTDNLLSPISKLSSEDSSSTSKTSPKLKTSKFTNSLEELPKISNINKSTSDSPTFYLNSNNNSKELSNVTSSGFCLPLISLKTIYTTPYGGCDKTTDTLTNSCIPSTSKNVQNETDFLNSELCSKNSNSLKPSEAYNIKTTKSAEKSMLKRNEHEICENNFSFYSSKAVGSSLISSKLTNSQQSTNSSTIFNSTNTWNSPYTSNSSTLSNTSTSNSVNSWNSWNSPHFFNLTTISNTKQTSILTTTSNSANTLNSTQTLNSTKISNSPKISNSTSSSNIANTWNSPLTLNSPNTINPPHTLNSTAILNSPQTSNSTSTLSLLNISKSTSNLASTWNSPLTINPPHTLNSTTILNAAQKSNPTSTLTNSTSTKNLASTLNSPHTFNSSHTSNSTTTLNSPQTSILLTSESSISDSPTQNSLQSSSVSAITANSTYSKQTSNFPSILISSQTTNSPLTSNSSTTPINFNSPPASPTPLDNDNEIQNSPLSIPLELSKTYFPHVNWTPKSLLHNLIDNYDENHYHPFHHDEQLNENEIQQMEIHLNEYINQTTTTNIEITTATKTQFDIKALNLVKILQSITNETKLIAKAIIKSIKKAKRPIIPPYEPYNLNKPTPSSITTTPIHDHFINQNFSTKAHQSIFYVFQHFNFQHFEELLNCIETTLFNVKNCDSLTLNDVLNITDLYLLILLQQQQQQLQQQNYSINQLKNPARLFIAKCLYYHKLKAWPMIYAVLSAFPTVLPHLEERNYDRSDPLITVIQHCLMCTKYDMDKSDLRSRELLSKLRFEYHYDCHKPDFQETLKNLIEKLCAGQFLNLKFAFAIFCKRLPPQRVINDVVQQYFIPLSNEYYRLINKQLLQPNDYEMLLSNLIDCFSTVIKPFPRDPTNPICMEVKNYFNFLKTFLNLNENPIVREAALNAILRLQRFDYINCYQALANLHFDFQLQSTTNAALKTFIYRKPKSFWKTLQMQNC